MTRQEFCDMARISGLIGAPCEFETTLRLIMDPGFDVEFDGPVGDVVARCYWADGKNGGCISIPREGL